MLLSVPLFGALVLGSWRAGWEYAKQWAIGVGVLFAIAAVLGLIMLPFIGLHL